MRSALIDWLAFFLFVLNQRSPSTFLYVFTEKPLTFLPFMMANGTPLPPNALIFLAALGFLSISYCVNLIPLDCKKATAFLQ